MKMAISHVLVMLLFSTLQSAFAGNIDTDQCPVDIGCQQCISSSSQDVERCLQLRFLITQSVSWQ